MIAYGTARHPAARGLGGVRARPRALFRQPFKSDGPSTVGAFGALFITMIRFDKVSQLLFYGARVIIAIVAGAGSHSRPAV